MATGIDLLAGCGAMVYSEEMGKRSGGELPLVLGLNSAYHESAAAIVRGFEVVFAAEEERYTREKHAKAARVTNPDQLPWAAIRDCLRAADCSKLADVDAVAYSLQPGKRFAMIGSDPYPIGAEVGFGTAWGEHTFDQRVGNVPQIISAAAEAPSLAAAFHFVPHHVAHAACAFHASGLKSAAILVVDGIGESATAWLGRGDSAGLAMIEEVPYPHSIGMLWERIAAYLGFDEYDSAKVMGLAAFGNPQRFAAAMDRVFHVDVDAGHIPNRSDTQSDCNAVLPFLVNPDLARFRAGDVAGLESLFGQRRQADESPTDARLPMLRPRCRGERKKPCWCSLAGCSRRPANPAWSIAVESRSTASPTAGSNVTGLLRQSTCTPLLTMRVRPSARRWRPHGE